MRTNGEQYCSVLKLAHEDIFRRTTEVEGSESRLLSYLDRRYRNSAPGLGSHARRKRDARRSPVLRRIALAAAMVAGNAFVSPIVQAQTVAPSPVEDRSQAVECLTLAIAYEAGYEPSEGQQAVAEVVLNRVRHPAFPKSVCNVVFAGSTLKTGCQFTFTCDGSMRRRLPESVFVRARTIAELAIDGQLPALVGDAINYHADYVFPYWAPKLERVTKIGAHIFYRRPGAMPAALAVAGPVSPQPEAPAPAGRPAEAFAPWGLAPRPTLPEPSAAPGS